MRQRLAIASAAVLFALAPSAPAAPPRDWPSGELKAFARQLTQYVLDHHLKTDPDSRQVGMVYEYYDVDRDLWIQGEALDTMHDGAWFANALVQMYRATGDAYYLEPLKQYVLPFYQNVLIHSDALFTDLTDAWSSGVKWEDPRPEKGFCPYWWDDGASVSLEQKRRETGQPAYPATDNLAGQPNPDMRLDGYSHGTSNHMAQDLAVMLGMYWLLTRDEQTALAARYLDQSRRRHHGIVHPVSIAAAASNNSLDELRQLAGWRAGFEWKEPHGEYYDALFKGQERQAPGFLDGLSYGYHSSILLQRYRPFSPAYARHFLYAIYTDILLRDLWYDDAPPTPGIARFDLSVMPLKDGRFELYHSDGPDYPVGSRMGPMMVWASAIGLQLLREFPTAWDDPTAAQDGGFSVPMLRQPRPVTHDGWTADMPRARTVGGAALSLASTPRQLDLVLWNLQDGVRIAVEPLPPAAGQAAHIAVTPDGTVSASNAAGETLLCESRSQRRAAGRDVWVRLPYTVAKGQTPWLNGVEDGRLLLRVGDETVPLHFHSSTDTVRAALQQELADGLRAWQQVFEEWGYIPTGWYPPREKRSWGAMSDTGGYAHLLTAIAAYLDLQAGRPSWKHVTALTPP